MITDEENWEVIKTWHVYGTKTEKLISELKQGDKVVMYLIRTQISGLFEIESLKSNKNIRFNDEEYKFFIDLKPIKILKKTINITSKWDNPKIIENVSIFKNSLRWGTILMGRSIIEITKDDYEYIKGQVDNVGIK
jgi:predicted RNA-binding protein